MELRVESRLNITAYHSVYAVQGPRQVLCIILDRLNLTCGLCILVECFTSFPYMDVLSGSGVTSHLK